MLGGAWLTKSPALFFALMLPTLWVFTQWKKGSKLNVSKITKLLGLTLVTVIIGYGMYNILRLGPNFSVIARRNLDYVWPLSRLWTSPLDPLKPFLDRSREWLWMMGPVSLFVLWLLGYVTNLKKYWKQIAVLTIWFLFPVVVQSEFAKVLTARYILFSIPFLVVIAASTFTTENKKWIKILTLLFAFFVSQSLVFNYRLLTNPEKANLPRSERSGYLEEWTAGHGISEIANFIRQQSATEGVKIVVGTEGFFGTLPDGMQMYLNDQPQITVIGVGLNFEKLPNSLAESFEAGNKTYFVVNRSRFHSDLDTLGLKIIAEYPKAVKPDGSQDALLLMEVTDEEETSN
jgi:hypothetical protein